MGHRLTPSEEAQQIRQATREAHEAAQQLKDLLREARLLAATLTTEYQAYHDRELKELANALIAEHNQASADLNTAIEQARIMIVNQIMTGSAVFDRSTSTVTISWGAGKFDDQQPPPYPGDYLKESRS